MNAIIDLPELRQRVHVFRDRAHAGKILAEMLAPHSDPTSMVMAIPAGGVPVALEAAKRLKLELDLMVVSKITLPWNTEAGYGAVAFDGTVRLNHALTRRLGLTQKEIQQGIQETRDIVQRRVLQLRGSSRFPKLEDRKIFLIDDGLASGFTMIVAVEALRTAGAETIAVAVPTAHLESLKNIETADRIFCANIRSGMSFAVAEAYQHWSDVAEKDVIALLKSAAAHDGGIAERS